MPTLNWIGKEAVVNHHHDVPYRTLDKQYTFDNGETIVGGGRDAINRVSTENKIIHGDNLEALKALLPEYEGRIKCIYIDPPYNTGNENWVYNDNVNSPKIQKWLGQVVGKEAEDLSRHDKWLCMMYPRLKLLHQLLADDGAIFISIDDNEQANLKLLCDEIFGAGNFVGNICHKSRSSVSNDLIISQNHNLILFYTKNYNDVFNQRRNFRLSADESSFKLNDNDGKGKYKLVPVDGPGGAAKGNPHYEFLGVLGYWRYNQETMQELFDRGEIVKRKTSLSRKYYLSKALEKGGKSLTTWWDDVGSATNGTNLLKNIFESKIFDTPKPLELLERIVKISTDKNSIILDSFAGSGTTAHAVLNLNKQDGGNRKFILVEMEDYAENITAERVRRVISGYGRDAACHVSTEGTGGSFSYYELGEPIFTDDQNLNESVGVEKLREYIWYSETRVPYCRDGVSGDCRGGALGDCRDGALGDCRDAARHVSTRNTQSYLLGNHDGTDYYFYYEPDRITTLSHDTLNIVERKADTYVIYADQCIIDKEWLNNHHIIFKKIPRDIRKF